MSARGGGETARQRTETRTGDGDALHSPSASGSRLYADEERVDSVTFLVKNSPSALSAFIWRYRQYARIRARFAMHSGPLVYNGCAE